MSAATAERTTAVYLRHAEQATHVYTRISRDRLGAGLGVGRQLADCEAYAAEHGLTIGQVHSDNDLSAYSSKPRPGYDALIRAMEAGEVGTLLAWHTDRLTRQPAELEHLMDVARRTGTRVRTVTAGELDPTSPDGMLMARLTGSIAAYESAHKSRRITRKMQQLADQGKPHGGRRRFGYEPGMVALRDGTTPVLDDEGQPTGEFYPDEARWVRAIATRLLAGGSLHGLATWLNDEGVATATGAAKWTGPNLGLMMKRPHLAGLRVHRGEVVGHGDWPAIITEGQHQEIVSMLSNAARKTNTTGNARVYLLAGLATCATCGEEVRGRPLHHRRADGSVGRAYACKTGRHVHRPVADVDEVVTEHVLARLERMNAEGDLLPEHAADDDDVAALTDEHAGLVARRDEVEDDYMDGKIDAARRDRLLAKADARLVEVADALDVARAARNAPRAALDGMTGPQARARWAALLETPDEGLGQRRIIVDALAEVSLVGGGRFDPEQHVVITWRSA